ncbi:secreted protein containing Peptidase S53, propeptide domain protein [mine drainage metagenome]|uniref:Secreted protein containing Peptidase S53, propeptide domain protein n=1 Tax=mine drainage metagenome TaxID=410659 RepID=T0ZPV6_9ZZZZ
MVLVTLLLVVSPSLATAAPRAVGGTPSGSLPSSARAAVPLVGPAPPPDPVRGPYEGPVRAMVQLPFRHAAGLSALLAGLQDPSSSQYHRYLTRAEFDALYSPSAASYRGLAGYFHSFGIQVTVFSGRTALALSGTSSEVGAAFGTTFEERVDPVRGLYYTTSGTPTFPDPSPVRLPASSA